MSDSRKVIGFHDVHGHLNQWFEDECDCWNLANQDKVFTQGGEYVLRTVLGQLTGELAREIPAELAAELLLGSGHPLPCELVPLLSQTKFEKPKTTKRSKPRKPKRPPKSQWGLAGFVTSKRQRDSREPFG